MKWPLTSESARREAWREHCAPLIESGRALVYGSPEHIEAVARKRAEKAAEKKEAQS